jgi:hypothetical protein
MRNLHLSEMDQFSFEEPADLFVGSHHPRSRNPVKYLRFKSGAEAIRHAVEMQSEQQLAGTYVEVGDIRVGVDEIRALYESSRYPLPRPLQR